MSDTKTWARKGDKYMIRNSTIGGQPVEEGVATLVKPSRLAAWLDSILTEGCG